MCERNPIQCIIPPYITDELVKSADAQVRSRAVAQIRTAARMRAFREAAQAMPKSATSQRMKRMMARATPTIFTTRSSSETRWMTTE